MSHIQNTKWLEYADDNFLEAVSEKNWEQAKAVVDDIAEKGFVREAVQLFRELLVIKMSAN